MNTEIDVCDTRWLHFNQMSKKQIQLPFFLVQSLPSYEHTHTPHHNKPKIPGLYTFINL